MCTRNSWAKQQLVSPAAAQMDAASVLQLPMTRVYVCGQPFCGAEYTINELLHELACSGKRVYRLTSHDTHMMQLQLQIRATD